MHLLKRNAFGGAIERRNIAFINFCTVFNFFTSAKEFSMLTAANSANLIRIVIENRKPIAKGLRAIADLLDREE